jgi:hypothetical protein
MSSEAVRQLECFMGKRKEDDTLEVSALLFVDLTSLQCIGMMEVSALCGLDFTSVHRDDGTWSEAIPASIVYNNKGHLTAGSRIRSVTLGPVLSGFVAALADRPYRFYLTSLSTYDLSTKECKDLA